ncbi:MAG: hypothetical protein MJD61_19355 [Proteobacteria bacterium]|nr:hypothetical protein [Pseudomonadota bacterium]
MSRNSAVEHHFRPRVAHPAAFLRGLTMSRAPFLRGYVGLPSAGPFQLVAQHRRGERLVAERRYPFAVAYPREHSRLRTDQLLLQRIAAGSGGRFDPPPSQLFIARGDGVVEHIELWRWFIPACLALFVGELGLRRLYTG